MELALDETAQRGLPRSEALRACKQCSRALNESLAELQHIRGALAAVSIEDQRRAENLAQSVLGRTTREELSWRGNWRSARRFLRERRSPSPRARLMAASLLLLSLALPVFAIALAIRARETERLVSSIDTPLSELAQPMSALEPRREKLREPQPESVTPLSESADSAPDSDRLSKARRELIQACSPHASGSTFTGERAAGPCGDVEHLLIARRERLGLGGLDNTLSEPAANAPLLERALWGELLLDDWALSGRADPRLALALGRLFDGATPARTSRGSPAVDAQANLALHALERAASYGFDLPGFEASPEPRPALEPAWFEQLDRACAAVPDAETSGVVAVWLAWGRHHAP